MEMMLKLIAPFVSVGNMQSYQERLPLLFACFAQPGSCQAATDLSAVRLCYLVYCSINKEYDLVNLFIFTLLLNDLLTLTPQETARQANMVSTTPFASNALPGAYVLRTFLLDDVLK